MSTKVAIITGGSKGIGESCVRAFVKNNYYVGILDVDNIAGNQLAEELGDHVRFIHCDVASTSSVDAAIDSIFNEFGRLDVLVNNAGILGYTTVTETDDETWERILGVNLSGAFRTARKSIPLMKKTGGGVIINVSSVQAFVTQEKVAPYTTSKTALLGLTRSIAVDYAPEIRCVAVCPGTIDTPMLRTALKESPDPDAVYQECVDMHLSGKVGDPDEVADLISFLASDRASFITGQAIRVDGGLGIRIGGSKQD